MTISPGGAEYSLLAALVEEVASELRNGSWGLCERCFDDLNHVSILTARHEQALRETAALVRQMAGASR